MVCINLEEKEITWEMNEQCGYNACMLYGRKASTPTRIG